MENYTNTTSEKLIRDLSIDEFKDLLNNTIRQTIDDEIEDLLALKSDEYLESIEEARKNFSDGNFKTFGEVF